MVNWNLAAARDLPVRQRWSVLAALVVLGLMLLTLDHAIPGLELRPFVVVLLVICTAFGGMRFGMTYAVLAAPAFTYVEWASRGDALDFRLAINTLAATVSFAVTPVIVVYLQRRLRLTTNLETKLRRAEMEQRRLAEIAATRLALARSEAKYRAVGEAIPFGTWQTDADGKLTYISDIYCEVCGMSIDQLKQGGWLERVPRADAERFLAKWAARDAGGDIWESEYRLRGVDGKIYAILSRGARLKGDDGKTIGWAGVSLDLTARKRAEDAIALLEEAGRQLVLSLDPLAILERVAGICVARFADWVSIDLIQEDGRLRNAVVSHRESQRLDEARELEAYAHDPESPRGAPAVARTGKSELVAVIDDALLETWAQDERHMRLLRRLDLRSAMFVPLIARERVFGTMTLFGAESGKRYDEEDLAVAEVLGVRTALAYQNALHYAREVRVADTLQQASLPHELPQLPGMRINATYAPGASESEIGGDWYDAFMLPDGKVGITIGDVAGKGLRAAVAMGMVRQALRGAALDGLSPAAALKRVNKHLCHERTGMVTAIAATLDPANSSLRYACAGHPPMIVVSAQEPALHLQTPGVPLGLFNETMFVEAVRPLRLGDLVVLYTDGLIENNRNVAQGEVILSQAATTERGDDSPNPALSILHRVIRGQPKDDVAILTVAISPAPVDRIDVEAPAVPASARILRHALRRLAIGVGLSDEATFPLLVAAGEAISNAIEHAYGSHEGSVRIRGSRSDGRLIIEVSDHGKWRLPRDEGRGRGLPLIRSIVEETVVLASDEGTTVRLAVPLVGPKSL